VVWALHHGNTERHEQQEMVGRHKAGKGGLVLICMCAFCGQLTPQGLPGDLAQSCQYSVTALSWQYSVTQVVMLDDAMVVWQSPR
jgi:hypothetical protein